MSVERRCHKRIGREFDVIIRYRQRSFVGRTGNLSMGGIFLQSEFLTIPTGTMIELEVGLKGRDWQLAGLVMHADSQGIGVMFRTLQPELFMAAKRGDPAAPMPAHAPRQDQPDGLMF